MIGGDYKLTPTKPTFMGEGAYPMKLKNSYFISFTIAIYEDDIYHITTDPWGVRLNAYWV